MELIALTRGKLARVDDGDYEWLNRSKWCYNGRYAVRVVTGDDGKQHTVFMHRIIAETPYGMYTDHIDGDGLNDQRANLRICTRAENSHNRGMQANNTSGFKGVSWETNSRKWKAAMRFEGRSIRIGYYSTALEAAIAYDQAALRFHGEFARLNLPDYETGVSA